MSPWPSVQVLAEAKKRLKPVKMFSKTLCITCPRWFMSELCDIHYFTAPTGRIPGARGNPDDKFEITKETHRGDHEGAPYVSGPLLTAFAYGWDD